MSQGYRLAPQQRRLWLWHQLEPGFPDSVAVVFELKGRIDPQRWRAALELVLANHEVLRTRLVSAPGFKEPFQVIDPVATHSWRESTGPANPDSRPAFAQHLLEAWANAPSACDHAHVAYYACGAESALCLLALPAHQADAPSLERVLAAWVEAHENRLDENPIQFVEVSEWLQELITSEAAQAGISFWRSCSAQLAPTTKPIHPSTRWRFDRLSGIELGNLDQLGEVREVQDLCLAVWFLLHARQADTRSMALTSWAGGRQEEDLNAVIGPLANALPLVLELDPAAGIQDVVAELRRRREDVELWQACFAWELFELGDNPPWYPLAFTTAEALPAIKASPELELVPLQYCCIHEPFTLRLGCHQGPMGWLAVLEFECAHYSAGEVSKIGQRFAHMLAQFAANPTLACGQAELMPPSEAKWLLEILTGPELATPKHKHIIAAFRNRVLQAPHAPALIFDDLIVTYEALANAALAMAQVLRRRGVGVEDRVGLYLEPSPEAYAALIGIFWASAVFVPLDPELPQTRLRFMHADARLKLVLTSAELEPNLRDAPMETVLVATLTPSSEPEFKDPDPAQGAYLIYTSGSTGTPKGILIPHGPLQAHVHAARDFFQITSEARVLQMTNFGFDPAQEQIWTTLTSGATLVPARPKQWDPEHLLERLTHLAITHANWTSSYWQHLVHTWTRAGAAPVLPLKHVIVGGEAMDPVTARLWREFWPGCRLINAYGPTETIISATAATGFSGEGDLGIPVGTPLAGRCAYLLDRAGQAVPPGTPGELALGGPLLARGYVGRAGLTANHFRPDPNGRSLGARLYLSGDRMLMVQNQLFFLGRNDGQVKIRGFRVELGEIERALARIEVIEQVAVVARNRAQGELELVAFYSTGDGGQVSSGQLRSDLAAELPAYMVPAFFQQLSEWPKTISGKLDRHALSQLPLRQVEPSRVRNQASPLAEVLSAIWTEVLNVNEIHRSAHFFELGGHSLLAIQLVSRIRAALDLHFPLETVFRTPIYGEMLAELERLRQTRQGEQKPPLIVGPRPAKIPLSFAQQRLFLAIALNRANDAYHVPMAVAIEGALSSAVLERSFAALLERHESLRTRFRLEDDLPVQEIGPVDWRLNFIDGTALAPSDSKRLVDSVNHAHALRPFNLEQGPCYRALLLQTAPHRAVFCITIHHISCDAWSLEILSRELAQLYTAFAAKRPSSLAPLPVQYADYALWQRDWLKGAVLDRELGYWRRQLADLPRPLNLPGLSCASTRAGRFNFSLDQALTQACVRLARNQEVTLFMLILAAFDVLLLHHTGETDLVVGTDSANRDWEQLEGLIAFFINQLVLRADLSGDPSFVEVLARIRKTTLAAFQHQETPFDKLVEDLNPARDAQSGPFFQVKCVLVNTPQREQRLPGLSFKPLPTPERDTKLDLQLNLWEDQGALQGQLRYKSEKFDPNWIQSLAQGFQETLALVVNQPNQTLAQINQQLTESEQQLREQLRTSARNKVKDKFSLFKR